MISFFPTGHNHSLCYVNKTGWLSMDLSAAAAVCCAPENHAAERDPRLKPRQNLTSGKVTHHISFTLSILGDAASFCVFLLKGNRHCGARASFQPWSQFCFLFFFLKKVAAGVLRFLPQERNWSSDSTRSPARIKTDAEQYESKAPKSLEGGIFAILEML